VAAEEGKFENDYQEEDKKKKNKKKKNKKKKYIGMEESKD